MMVSDQIEKLKREYTDKWVSVLDGQAPELSRYRERFGQVKTVNMNGRALVEFHGGLDIGWIDIDLNYLKVIEKPDFEAIEAKKKAAAKAAPKKKAPAKSATKSADSEKLSPLEMARQMDAAKKKDSGGKPSTADILAAARGKGGSDKASAKPPAEKSAKPASGGKMSTSDILAAARGGTAAASPAKLEPKADKPTKKESPKATEKSASGGKMSTADILAAARGNAGAATPAQAPEEPAEETSAPEPVSEEPQAESQPATDKPASGELPKDIPGILAYCRQADTK
ncbi:MAG: hypothetical protein MPJ50_10015 [Pirellulales bacterium]|nr:hypothetical protein [Pirellulales bacterium]